MTAHPTQDVSLNKGRHLSLTTRIGMVEADIRRQPTLAVHRWTLFQWLCMTHQWARAIRQLQVYAQLEPTQSSVAHACRDLVRAELWRAKVLAGQQEPGAVFDDMPVWMRGLLDALRCGAQGKTDASDDARERALDHAPVVAGRCGDRGFEWIADSDSRLGPVFEFITAGRYRWVSLADIANWRIERPSTLIDLVWAPCTLSLADGARLRGFVPARYPVEAHEAQTLRDALQFGGETMWHEAGRTCVMGVGRKTWATSAGDFDLFDLAECSLGADTNDGCSVLGNLATRAAL